MDGAARDSKRKECLVWDSVRYLCWIGGPEAAAKVYRIGYLYSMFIVMLMLICCFRRLIFFWHSFSSFKSHFAYEIRCCFANLKSRYSFSLTGSWAPEHCSESYVQMTFLWHMLYVISVFTCTFRTNSELERSQSVYMYIQN